MRPARFAVAVAAGCLAALTLPVVASANEDHPGCQGLYETARFRTFQQVGETHGHETVHHVFERLGCGDHHD
jgi:hypothetical protein